MLQPFYIAPNLHCHAMVLGFPWDFCIEDRPLAAARGRKKDDRRRWTLNEHTSWNVYSPVRGLNPSLRVTDTNPASGLAGLVVDYDTKCDIDAVLGYLKDSLSEDLYPNFVEHSLSINNRLVWVFQTVLLTTSTAHNQAMQELFADKLKLRTLLPGFDEASFKPSQLWTNGGEWLTIKDTPLDSSFTMGVAIDIGRKTEVTGKQEVPLEVIATEVQTRYPGRWTGDFLPDSQGVRFWDEKADNPMGCQVKPDGMLCFTGPVAFMSWGDIFGHKWVNEARAKTLGAAAEGIYFEGRQYYRQMQNTWMTVARQDILLHLQNKGLSDKIGRGRTVSDCGEVLAHIQEQNRVHGAAPLVNYPSGIVETGGQRILNTARLSFPTLPTDGTGDPLKDCPWIWKLVHGMFPHPELMPFEHFMAQFSRAARSVKNYERTMGQIMFICGPIHNGKTLLLTRIMTPCLGGRTANPYDYLVGGTSFNDDIFQAYFLTINDEEAPRSEAERRTFQAHMKGMVVNAYHTHQAKFCNRVNVEWNGRIAVTLNDDPGSAGMLPEVNSSTRDKMSFYRTVPYAGEWPDNATIEAIIDRELPYFYAILLAYQAPKEVTDGAMSRYGVKSYYDPQLLEMSTEQLPGYNLLEIIRIWLKTCAEYSGEGALTFEEKTPSSLLSTLRQVDTTRNLMNDWPNAKTSNALTALARTEGSGVTRVIGKRRTFRLDVKIIIAQENE